MNMKWIKIIGMVATVGGAALSLVGSWATEKQNDAKIAEKAAEAVANLMKGES